MPEQRVVTSFAEVCSILDDPAYLVPPAEPSGAGVDLAWLRASVSRFCNGSDHARRRGLVAYDLARLDLGWLRRTSYARTQDKLRKDPMAQVARRVPVGVLASALGIDAYEDVVDPVITVAAAYQPGATPEQQLAADDAVERLVQVFGPHTSEEVANRVGLLIQACEPTTALISNTLTIALQLPRSSRAQWSVDALVAETLRFDSPVLRTRRVSPSGASVVLELAAANHDPATFDDAQRFMPGRRETEHVTFGHGPRACPAAPHALALACGVIEAVR